MDIILSQTSEEPREARRLEGRGGPWFETHRFAMLLTMRPREAS